MSDAILLTGATSDIGLEVAKLVAPGTTLLAQCRRSDGLSELIQARPDLDVVPLVAELSDRAQVERVLKEVNERSERVVGVVHLAAPKLQLNRFKELEWSAIDHALEVQVHSIARILQGLLPRMVKSGGASVVLVLSSVTVVPQSFMFDYMLAKHALLGVMRALSVEYVGKGIRVNAVSPSMTETKFLSELPRQVRELAAEQHPLKRNATPVEVAKAIHFLLSASASFVSGVNLAVTGGEGR